MSSRDSGPLVPSLHESLSITRMVGHEKAKIYHYTDLYLSGLKLDVFSPSAHNLVRAVNERVFFMKVDGEYRRPYTPIEDAYGLHMEPVAHALDEMSRVISPLTREQVPDLYSGSKRDAYRKAVARNCREPLDASLARLKAFGKIEAVPQKPDPNDGVMRLIHPRDIRYCAELARYIRPVEHLMYKNIDRMFSKDTITYRHPNSHGRCGRRQRERTVFKGLDAFDQAAQLKHKWNKYESPVCIMLDASRFDQSVSLDALQWEHRRYLKYFKGAARTRLEKLLDMQLFNKATIRTPTLKMKYEVEGGRMSGDMNTGLGNCLLMCSLVKAYCELQGLEKYSVANNGDDCLVICDSSDSHLLDYDLIADYFRSAGFSMKIEDPVYTFEQIDFCQTHPVWNGESYVMCRNPLKCLSKDTMSLVQFTNVKEWVSHTWVVAQCGLALTSGIPVLQEFYLAMDRTAKENCPENYAIEKKCTVDRRFYDSGFARLAKGLVGKITPVTSDARVSFTLAFGVLPESQRHHEREIGETSCSWEGTHRERELTRRILV